MARIKKYGETYDPALSTYKTFITDTAPNSIYFRISNFNEIFTGGKNGFLIEGSEHLLQSTEIKISVLDVEGTAVYTEPGDGIPEYYEGINKIVSVHVYEDTPIGQAKITILGELKTYIDENGIVRDVPDDWKGVYNVKWEKVFTLNKNLSNEDLVRFYKRPKVSITELVKPVYSAGFVTKTQTGLALGQPLVPTENTLITNFNSPTSYRIKIPNTNMSWWTGSMVDSNITFPTLNYTSTVESVVSDKELVVVQPYTEDNVVKSFTAEPYNISFRHIEGVTNIATALTGSYAKININDLTTFVGDVARVRVFRKSESDVSDYQFVQEIQLEANELLIDTGTKTKNQENYGIFTQDIISTYWNTSNVGLTSTFNQTYLYSSVRLDGGNTPYWFHVKDVSSATTTTTDTTIPITKGGEYTLDFNIRLLENVSSENYIRAFLSGSKQSTYQNVTKTIQVEQTIDTIYSSNSLLQKSTISNNIIAEEIENARIYFEVKGSGWHIANVSFKASQETAFSPDAITFIQPVPRSLPVETFLYRFEFYDINLNFIPVTVEAVKEFNGGNLQTIRKGLTFTPTSIYFTFDSASVAVPPLLQSFKVTKTLLTGSVTYRSASYDSEGNLLNSSQYTGPGSKFPGFLTARTSDNPIMSVTNFTGSRDDIDVQYIVVTGEVEGFEDSVTFSRVLDGFGGVSHIIRPYRGVDIRNSSTQSLEIQAVRVDGVNEVLLNSSARPNRGWNLNQLHVLSRSLNYESNPNLEPDRFVNLMYVTASKYIKGVTVGKLGSKEIVHNAVFDRDAIDKRLTVYLMPSCSLHGPPAYATSASVLTSIVLSDFQDGLDSGFFAYDTDHFNINFRNGNDFIPVYSNVTGSFYVRGTNDNPLTASLTIYPSMSINKDFTPEYWMYYVTHSKTWNENIYVVATDDKNNIVKSRPANSSYDSFLGLGSFVKSPLNQSKTLTITYTYLEPYTSASVSIDKTFTIVPEGRPGDEPVVFEVTPATVGLKANPKGIVNSYSSSVTEIRLKQGSRYLSYTSSRKDGTFYAAQESFTSQKINPGYIINVPKGPGFNKDYTGSLFIGTANSLIDLSGSVTYKLEIQPYYTSSVYSASFTQNFTKIMDGPPPIEVILSPISPSLTADEVGYVTNANYEAANTTLKIREGADYLTFTSKSSAPGTFRIQGTGTNIGDYNSISPSNIQIGIIHSSSADTATVAFNRFDYPYVSASAIYNIVVFPYSLGAGHQYTSSIVTRTQSFTKNVAQPASRTVTLDLLSSANGEPISKTINFDADGLNPNPSSATLVATAVNTTGSVWYQFLKDGVSQTGFDSLGPNYGYQTDNYIDSSITDLVSPGENTTWTVKIRDGNSNSAIIPIRAQASLTISGVKEGAKAYNALLTNESSAMLYKVSGQQTRAGTGTRILATKGDVPLTHKQTFSAKQQNPVNGQDIGSIGEYQVTISSFSPHLTLAGSLQNGYTVPTVSGEAVIGDLLGWVDEINNQNAQIVYKIDFENGRQITYKTQSFSVQYEGNIGPGIVMRGEWRNDLDYIGLVETTNYRRDAVIYRDAGTTKYYQAVSGSGPATYKKHDNGALNPALLVGPQTPVTNGTSGYWQYLGEQEFFVAAAISIFDISYVRNTLNVGTKNDTNKFANIVLAGGRTDPYIAIGQTGTVGTGGTAGSTFVTPGILGYDRPGIFMGLYENPVNGGTNGRFSIKSYDGVNSGTRGMFWDGDTLTIKGHIAQTQDGAVVGRNMGAWTANIQYYTTDQVTYGGYSWASNSNHISTNNTLAGTGYPGSGPWSISPYAAKTIRMAASAQVFTELKDGSVTPNYIQFDATKENISATTSWSTSPSVTLYDAATGGSAASTGDTVYLRKADFGTNTLVKVTSTSDSRSDVISVVRVKEGSDAITIILTNESHSYPAANDGTIANYGAGGTDIYLYEGATQLDYDGIGTAAGKWKAIATGTKITPGTITDGGTYARVAMSNAGGNTYHSAMTDESASVSFAITGKKVNGDSFSFTKVQSLTRVRKGDIGFTGAGIVYRGDWASGVAYQKDANRIDVVSQPLNTNKYWMARTPHTSTGAVGDAPPTSGTTQNTNWETFGATFTSVATDILFSQDVYANRTINIGMGTNGAAGTSGRRIEMSSDYPSGVNPFIRIGNSGYDTAGVFMGYDGGSTKFSLKNATGTSYLRWTGTAIEITTPNFTLDALGNITATNATLTGTVQASTGYLGGVNGWYISAGLIRDSNSRIRLNATTPSIEIWNSSGAKKVDIKSGALTSVGGSTAGIAVNPGEGPFSGPPTTIYSWYGSSNRVMGVVGPAFVVPTTGLYKFNSPSWFSTMSQFIYFGGGTSYGLVWMELHIGFYTTSTPTYASVPVTSLKIGETAELGGYPHSGPGSVDLDPIAGDQFISFTAGTYYPCAYIQPYGGTSKSPIVINYTNTSLDPSSNNMALQLDQIEITDEGILVINDSEKYIKIVRDLSPGANVSMLEAKQNNSSKPTLQISNVSVNNYNNEGIALNIPDGGVNIAERLWVQGMLLDPVSPGTNYAVKAIWQAGQRKGELFGSTSTRRNKKDITDWNFNVLDKIKLVNVKEFRYKHWPDTTELTLGMIAEDLRDAGFAYAPMYDFDENGEKTNEVSGIDWENVSVILWKGLQELNARVESLENK
jgi:hypothetical protein